MGRACGVTMSVVYHKNFKTISTLIPLPARLSKTNHNACITSTNKMIKKVAKKGIKKLFNIYLSNVFTDAKVVG